MANSGREIVVEQFGAVRRLSLNRPEMRNAQSRALLDMLDQAFTEAGEDDATRVVVLAGKGKHFSAGHDLKEAQANRSFQTAEDRFDQEDAKYLGYCMRIYDFPKPTIAQVQGACITSGFMMANMCDLVVASEDAFFADPACVSIACAGPEVMIAPYVLGFRKAKEFLFTGGRMTAQEALDAGMVNRVVPLERLEEETLELAQKVAKAAPFAVKLTKRSLNRMADLAGLRAGINAHFDTHQITHHTREFAATVEAGLAKAIESGKALSKAG